MRWRQQETRVWSTLSYWAGRALAEICFLWRHRANWLELLKELLFAEDYVPIASRHPERRPERQEAPCGGEHGISPRDSESDTPGEEQCAGASSPALMRVADVVIPLIALGLALYFLTPSIRSLLVDSRPSQQAKSSDAHGAAGLSEGPSAPDFRVMLPESRRRDIRDTMETWVRIVQPGLGEEDVEEQTARLRVIVGIKSEQVATDPSFTFGKDGDSVFVNDISAACIAGRSQRPHLIVTVGRAVFLGEGYSFAVSWGDHLYGVQQLNKDAYEDGGPFIVEEGIAEAFAADFDQDGVTEAIVTWRQGSGAYLSVSVHKLRPGDEWRRVWSSSGNYQGSAAIAQPEGSEIPRLVVVGGVLGDHNWDPKLYVVEEYEWDPRLGTLAQIREGFADQDWDPQAIVGPVGPMGMPLTFETEPATGGEDR